MLQAAAEVARCWIRYSFIDEARMKAFEIVLEKPASINAAVKRLLTKKSPWER